MNGLLTRVRKHLFRSKRGSPLVEEAILIGIAFFGLLLLFGAVAMILDWFLKNSDQVLKDLLAGFT